MFEFNKYIIIEIMPIDPIHTELLQASKCMNII